MFGLLFILQSVDVKLGSSVFTPSRKSPHREYLYVILTGEW